MTSFLINYSSNFKAKLLNISLSVNKGYKGIEKRGIVAKKCH